MAKGRKNFLHDADNCNILLAQTKGNAEGEILYACCADRLRIFMDGSVDLISG